MTRLTLNKLVSVTPPLLKMLAEVRNQIRRKSNNAALVADSLLLGSLHDLHVNQIRKPTRAISDTLNRLLVMGQNIIGPLQVENPKRAIREENVHHRNILTGLGKQNVHWRCSLSDQCVEVIHGLRGHLVWEWLHINSLANVKAHPRAHKPQNSNKKLVARWVSRLVRTLLSLWRGSS